MAFTPQMKQSIELLTMAVKELNEYIDSSLEKNPLLQKGFDKKTLQSLGKGPAIKTNVILDPDYKEKPIRQEENPRSSLLSQIRMLNLEEKLVKIAEYLIDEMDDNGYLRVGAEEAAKDLSVAIEDTQKTLSMIQTLDPPGIGARDVRECLQIQLRRADKTETLEYTIVTDFINELATNDVKKISSSLNIEENKVSNAIKNIKRLNPRPASTLLGKEAPAVIPDLVASIKNQKVRLELNSEYLPRLRLYNPYENKLDIIKDPEVKEFLQKNMNAAKQLIDNLKRREETMCRVADCILKFQKDGLTKDLSHIKSLTMKEVATMLDLHPSTISRTVANKYIQVNDKVIPLKSLLSHSMEKENGDLISKTAIKNKIKELISKENKAKPLSDKAITEELSKRGIKIERRTVAKYRESLRILPTYLRKKKGQSI